PPDVAWAIHRSTADQDEVRVACRADRDAITRLEDKQPLRSSADAADFDLARDHIDRTLLVFGIKRHGRAGFEPYIGKDRLPGGGDWRTQAVQRASDDAERHIAFGKLRDVRSRGVGAKRGRFLVL